MTNSHRNSKGCVPIPGYDNELTRSVFGVDDPTLAQRTEYFFKKWREWWPNGVFLKSNSNTHHARKILTDLGLNEFVDFQIRFRQVRFCNQTQMAMACISDLKDHISHRIQED